MALRVRATFLEQPPEGLATVALNRTRSETGLGSAQQQDKEVALEVERSYCQVLSSKLVQVYSNKPVVRKSTESTSLWCKSGHSQGELPPFLLAENTSMSTQVGSDSDQAFNEAVPACRSERRRRRRRGETAAFSKDNAESVVDSDIKTPGPTVVPMSQTAHRERWADMVEDSDATTLNFEATQVESTNSNRSTRDDIRSSMNAGSWGHPELCSRPCLYFASGVCSNAKDCAFCHFSHSKRPAHLDKRQRLELEQLGPSGWAALMIPILESRVAAVDASEGTAQLVAAVAAQCSSRPSRSAPPRNQRVLMLTLRAMSLRSFTATMLRSGATQGFKLSQSIEALMKRLRTSTVGVTLAGAAALNTSSNTRCCSADVHSAHRR